MNHTKTKISGILLAVSLAFCNQVNAQCITGDNAHIGFSYSPSCEGVDTIDDFGDPDSAYAKVNLDANVEYIFGSSISTDYITVTDEAGNMVLASGSQPLNFTADTTGTYRFYIHASSACGNDENSRMFTMQCISVINDLPSGATVLTVDAPCNTTYTNVAAHHSTNEPQVSCKSTPGLNTMWFKFVAPASGSVKISADYAFAENLGPMTDGRMELYGVGDPSDFSTFTGVACDDDNGVTADGNNPIIYATGLDAGDTYYIAIDRKSNTPLGTFCLTVDELNESMLASSGTCTYGQNLDEYQEEYNGWLSLADTSGNLIANIRPNEAGNIFFEASAKITVNEGSIRSDGGGKYYLDRNFDIHSFSQNNDMQLFFKSSELAALQAADAAATIDNMNVTWVHSFLDCGEDFAGDPDDTELLTQQFSGEANGVAWVQVLIPDFSNFYLSAGSVPLPITLKSFQAENAGWKNVIRWESAGEAAGDQYELERSTDGKSFNAIFHTPAKGTAASYSFDDQHPLSENFYRLKMTGASGESQYSNIVFVHNYTFSAGLIVMPNPARDIVYIKSQPENGLIRVTDITGKLLTEVPVQNGSCIVDLGQYTSGMYFIRFTNGQQSETVRVTKL